jgi:hypothetical protein
VTYAWIHGTVRSNLDALRHFFAFAFNPVNWITNGSEQVIAIAIGFVLASLLWPPLRRRIHAFADRKLAPLHDHLTAIRKSHADLAQSHKNLNARLDALHAHIEKATGVAPPATVKASPKPRKTVAP